MMILRIALFLVAVVMMSNGELTAKEKIRMHKEWLEKRAALRYQNKGNSSENSTGEKTLLQTKEFPSTATDIKHFGLFNTIKKSEKENPSLNDVYPETEKRPSKMFNSSDKRTAVASVTEPFAYSTVISSVTTDELPSIESTRTYKNSIETDARTSLPDVGNFSRKEISKHARSKTYPRWGPWSTKSKCSRSCGGGVSYQERKCILNRLKSRKRIISDECVGLYRRYHLCNTQDCPPNELDFRYQQCMAFNKVLFQGKQYKWEPYVKDDAECELNCKPIGMEYFATLKESVIDGTSCSRPAEYYRKNYRGKAICLSGICKAIIIGLVLHASGIIASEFTTSGTVHCGGLICRPISGIFSRNPLPGGYVYVATLPAGASNISITEMKNSNNLLVLQTIDENFILNGNYSTSPSGIHEASGAIFDYRRIDGLTQLNGELIEGVTEWITCTGPIIEPINLMVFGHDANPGIKYEYLLPIGSNYDSEEDIIEEDFSVETDSETRGSMNLKSSGNDSENAPIRPTEKRRRKFNWKIIGFSPCSKSCGGGTQTPVIRCTKNSPVRYYSAKRCSHSEKPVINDNLLRCNTQPCPAYWRVEDWGDCRCNQGEGYREREIRCVQELAAGIVIQVNNAGCMEEKPSFSRKCDCPRINRRRTNYPRRIHAHAKAQEPLIISNITQRRVASYKTEKAGIWLASNWNGNCLAECGTVMEHRSIFCDRSSPNTERCDLRHTPDTTRPCKNDKPCNNAEWFTSEWGKCGGNCFNLTKSRQVFCIMNELIVDDYECMSEKPTRTKNCSFDEVEYCKPRWHYSSWTECSKTCGGGTQRRTVKCLDLNLIENTLKPSQMCRYSDREPIYRSCNTEKCEDVLDQRVDVIQNDILPACIDEFPNCHLVIKARLCGYEYYQQNCCYSCKKNPHINN